MIRVLLADDQALVRAGFASLLATQDDIEVVGETADGEEAVSRARALVPDVVLMDIRMPGMDGLAATRAIAGDDRLGGVRVVILTTFDLDEYVFEAICNGASGFLVKDTEPDELIRAVRVVASGNALLSPGVTRRLISEFASRAQPPPPRLDHLTGREREVTALVAGGLSNDEIAALLYLSPQMRRAVRAGAGRQSCPPGHRQISRPPARRWCGVPRPGWRDKVPMCCTAATHSPSRSAKEHAE